MTCEGRLRDSHGCSQVGFRRECAYGRVAAARATLMYLSAGLPTHLPGKLPR